MNTKPSDSIWVNSITISLEKIASQYDFVRTRGGYDERVEMTITGIHDARIAGVGRKAIVNVAAEMAVIDVAGEEFEDTGPRLLEWAMATEEGLVVNLQLRDTMFDFIARALSRGERSVAILKSEGLKELGTKVPYDALRLMFR
jgi:hypothetical protein